MAYPYAQEPAPRTRPSTVTISSYLLYVVAAVQLISAVIGLSVIGTMSRVFEDAYVGSLSSSARTLAIGSAVFGASIAILFAAGLTILAIFNNRGRQGSRITTWVIGGIALCCNGFGVLGRGGQFTTDFDSGTGAPSASEVERRLTDALPSWYTAATVTLAVISLLALLAVIILLALPASNAYFRRAAAVGGWDPSMQYGGASPYGAQSPYPYSPQQQPYPGQPPSPGQQPYPGQPPYPGQQPYPGQPVYPGQQPQYPPYPGQYPPSGDPATPPPGYGPPVSGSPAPGPDPSGAPAPGASGGPAPGGPAPGGPAPGGPAPGGPAPGEPPSGLPPRGPDNSPHTGSVPPADPWNPPSSGERPPSDQP